MRSCRRFSKPWGKMPRNAVLNPARPCSKAWKSPRQPKAKRQPPSKRNSRPLDAEFPAQSGTSVDTTRNWVNDYGKQRAKRPFGIALQKGKILILLYKITYYGEVTTIL